MAKKPSPFATPKHFDLTRRQVFSLFASPARKEQTSREQMLIRTRPQGRDMAQGRNNAALQSEINVQRIA